MTGVKTMEEFLRELRLRWLGQIKKMDDERVPVNAISIGVNGLKKGRPKKRWRETREKEMMARGLK